MIENQTKSEYLAEFDHDEHSRGRVAGSDWIASNSVAPELTALAGNAVLDAMFARLSEPPNPSSTQAGCAFLEAIGTLSGHDFDSSIYFTDGFIAEVGEVWLNSDEGQRKTKSRHQYAAALIRSEIEDVLDRINSKPPASG